MADGKFDAFILNMSRRDVLSGQDLALINSLPANLKSFRRGEELVAEHSRPGSSCLLIKGMAARAVQLSDGRQQITALHIPGDFVDLHAMMLKVMDHSVSAITDCQAVFVSHRALYAAMEKSLHLGRMFWLSTVIDAAMHRAWNARIGRLAPVARLGHLICEMYLRFSVVGLATENSFGLPVTQNELSDVFGLSVVHVNRAVQQLRRTGLITWKGTTIRIADLDALAKFSEFDPTYLNLFIEPR